MIAVDTNVLVYAHRRESPNHHAAAALLRGLAEGQTPWAIPWPVCTEFLSVVTNPRIWGRDSIDRDESWRQLLAWTASPTARLLPEPDGFVGLFERIARRPRVHGTVVHDARIAAICIAHGVETLLTCDRDFRIFPELKTRDPFQQN